MRWTKKTLDEETAELIPTDEGEMIFLGVKQGRPNKPRTIKTNLDLTLELAEELDEIAEFLGSTRQGVVKGFILNGLRDYFSARNLPKRKKSSG